MSLKVLPAWSFSSSFASGFLTDSTALSMSSKLVPLAAGMSDSPSSASSFSPATSFILMSVKASSRRSVGTCREGFSSVSSAKIVSSMSTASVFSCVAACGAVVAASGVVLSCCVGTEASILKRLLPTTSAASSCASRFFLVSSCEAVCPLAADGRLKR